MKKYFSALKDFIYVAEQNGLFQVDGKMFGLARFQDTGNS